MKKLKPNESRAKAAIILLWIVLGCALLTMIFAFLQLNLLKSIQRGAEVSYETAAGNDFRVMAGGILYTVAFIVSVVTFILWFRRAYFNLHLKVKNLSNGEGWAAGAWFVPILNLFRPFQIMKELYEATRDYLRSNGEALPIGFSTTWVNIWWGFWIVGNILGNISTRISLNAETLEGMITATWMDILSSAGIVIAALLAIKVIQDYLPLASCMHDIENRPPETAISDSEAMTGVE